MTLSWLLSIVMMVLGFGFVIFWHELGHFLGARRAGIRVEQFAVGMGHAIVSYRKGMGVRFGSTMEEFERRTNEEFDRRQRGQLQFKEKVSGPTLPERDAIAEELGLGETEYRLSMLPIGGYVKPTGQDDLRPQRLAAADDPKSYAAAPVGKRMVLISAGVIMNVILAGILFFVLFLFVGFKSQKAVVGQVQSGSPAAAIGLRGGDDLLNLDGHTLHDFTKVLMNVALLPSDREVPLVIRRDGVEQTLMVQPRSTSENGKMLALGFSPAPTLRGYRVDSPEAKALETELAKQPTVDPLAIRPGEVITAVDGAPIDVNNYAAFDEKLQNSGGKDVELVIRDAGGNTRTAKFLPQFAPMFNRQPLAFAGLMPRTRIGTVPMDPKDSAAAGVLREGDVILKIEHPDGPATQPTITPAGDVFRVMTTEAGAASKPLKFTVLRGSEIVELPPIVPTTKIEPHVWGLGVGLEAEVDHSVVGTVAADSAAAVAGIAPGSTITAINDRPVSNWPQVHEALLSVTAPSAVTIQTKDAAGAESTHTLQLAAADLDSLKLLRYANPLEWLDQMTVTRKTSNPLTALAWGVGDTRDLIIQGYQTIHRVFGGSVPANNMSGPIGIFRAGTNFAQRGTDWFIWFLAVVSANLAVVNFLPVPILDGWHFLSLVKEKITGRPVSERVQEVAQYVGLAMILSLLVFVSYNDIMRW